MKRKVLENVRDDFLLADAEAEVHKLPEYFIETDAWRQVLAGNVHVIKGVKGSGKSALYALLQIKSDELFDSRNILVVEAAEPFENAAFRSALARLQEDSRERGQQSSHSTRPLISELEFENLWKLYFLAVIGEALRRKSRDVPRIRNNKAIQDFIRILESNDLIPDVRRQGLFDIMRRVKLHASLGFPVGPTVGEVDATLTPSSGSERQPRRASLEELFVLADEALDAVQLTVWVALDRLDEAFANQSKRLEANGLRALVNAFIYFRHRRQIQPKIFVRADIFHRVTATGELTGLNKVGPDKTLEWHPAQLMDLAVRRVLLDDAVCAFYGIGEQAKEGLFHDYQRQRDLFHRIFPPMTQGIETFDWLMRQLEGGGKRGVDSDARVAPRSLIQFIHHAAQGQIDTHRDAQGDQLVDEEVLETASRQVSQEHYTQAFVAEFSDLARYTEALRNQRIEYSQDALLDRWRIKFPELSEFTAQERAKDLVEAGFFDEILKHGVERFRVAPLYRPAVNLQP
jgi:hypothetical protein